ncbi:MAG: C-GCAxxG-C-C family protein [Cetobacterium sp.]|uniref:C-GCAxxG-C-C family protein n=1 Tax=Cetobacterium sp. TaxID=2071632 RepID=UPI003F2C6F96
MFKRFFKKKEFNMSIREKEISLIEIKKQAETYYENGDYYCSEAVLKTIKDAFKSNYDDSIIGLASGFPMGLGGSGCTCGAISGGSMAISMFFGRKGPGDSTVKQSMKLTRNLYKDFIEKYETTCCKSLRENSRKNGINSRKHCVEITGEVAVMVAKILAKELDYKIIEEI